jgi:hypothetical protein
MKRFIVYLVVAVLVGGVIGGALIGGIAIGKSQGREEVTQELQNRTGQFTSGQQSGFTPPAGSTFIRGGTMGTVEKIEGGIITVTTTNGSVKIVTSSSTTVQKMAGGTLTDIKIGDTISIAGESQDDGSIQASSIVINPNTFISQ